MLEETIVALTLDIALLVIECVNHKDLYSIFVVELRTMSDTNHSFFI